MRLLLTLTATLLLVCSGFAQNIGDTLINNNPEKLKVKVLYFHITNRCNTCYSIETNVRKTIAAHFQTAIDTGSVGLAILNCELPANTELVKKYSAYGATLAMTVYKDGKELTTEDLTNFAFQKTHKPEVFINELKEKINTHLNN